MSIDNLLSRLSKVKKSGNDSWMCQCPAHSDKTASLAVKDLGDGRLILNCFAGCDTYSILQSIGMDWEDVMPEKSAGHHIKPEKQIIYATEALKIIRFETQMVTYIAFQMRKERDISQESVERLQLSMQRINKALEAARCQD